VPETRGKTIWPWPRTEGYRPTVALPARKLRSLLPGALAVPFLGCTTIDPGPNFSVATETFDADYFYCHVEPEFIFQQKCGPGLPSDNGSCHFSSAVNGMNLQDHPAIDCGGGDHPVLDANGLSRTDTGTGSPAQGNLTAVSFEMNRDYTMAPLFLRPTGQVAHPRVIFLATDVSVQQLLSTWASK
jgi:hypothetical protein